MMEGGESEEGGEGEEGEEGSGGRHVSSTLINGLKPDAKRDRVKHEGGKLTASCRQTWVCLTQVTAYMVERGLS